ncbi:MAG: SRPBCC domain-containing protein [Chitinophagaceae bacterium]
MNNFKQFTKRVTINAPAQQVYDAWTSQQALETWFLRLALFTDSNGKERSPNQPVQAGDSFLWLWFGYDDNAREERQVITANGKNLFSFSFSGNCTVTVLVKEEDGETVCELTQEIPLEDESQRIALYNDCGTGWTFYLANLKSILEGGIDLRNKNIKITNVINA